MDEEVGVEGILDRRERIRGRGRVISIDAPALGLGRAQRDEGGEYIAELVLEVGLKLHTLLLFEGVYLVEDSEDLSAGAFQLFQHRTL